VLERGGVRLRGNDPSDGEAVGPCLRISKQFRKGNSPKFESRIVYKTPSERLKNAF
jgi:hypothetical protein